jgi:hypothetical protein
MPAGYPSGGANQAPPFMALDALHATPEGRWETLKMLRLLQWLWRGTTGWPPSAPTATSSAYVAGLTTLGPLVTPPNISFPGLPAPLPYQLRYSDLLATIPVRLSRVAQMLNMTHPVLQKPGGGMMGATTVPHINDDWFSDNPAAPNPWKWGPGGPVAFAEHRERTFVAELIKALQFSLGVRPAPIGDPAGWPAAALGGSAWPPLVGDPQPPLQKLTAQVNIPALRENKPIQHFWDNQGGAQFKFQVLVGATTVVFTVTTPELN